MKYSKDRFASDLIYLGAFLAVFYVCLYLAGGAV